MFQLRHGESVNSVPFDAFFSRSGDLRAGWIADFRGKGIDSLPYSFRLAAMTVIDL